MKSKIFIFDFDGTIADTLDELILIFNKMADEYGFKKVDIQQKQILRGKESKDLFKMFNIPMWRLPAVVLRARKDLNSQITNIEIVNRLVEVIEKIAISATLGIITSNSEENVNKFFKRYGLDNTFSFIEQSKHLFGKHRVLMKVIKKYGYKKENVIYVGDETRDIEAAKKAGVVSVAVAWGFNSKNVLKKANPDYFVEKPEELCDLL